MDPIVFLIIAAVIWILIFVLAQFIGFDKLNEKGFEANTPFFLLIKTERLNAFLTKWGKKFPRAFWNLGIVVGFGGMILGFYIFADNFLKFFTQPAQAGGVVPIIPGVTITGLPLIYMLIGLAVTLITHEFAHGLASSREDIPIKSSGLLFFYVIFGGFVEPDEETFNQVEPKSRMRMLAAGSFANLITGLIVFVLIANFNPIASIAYNSPNGAYIYETQADSPGAAALQIGDVIVRLNETEIDTWGDVSVFMANTTSGSLLTIYTTNPLTNDTTILLGESPTNASLGYIGIFGADYWEPKPGWDLIFTPLTVFHMQQVLLWLWIILVSIGLLNLLPIPAFDGDKLLSNALSLVTDDEKKIKYVMWPARILSLTILLGSIILSLVLGKGIF
ncbi:MAG: site-2 protease family protein [Candidatus Thorarchaeota archaeon]|jgi:membrane-associated protease RseP (regulator of RpoE activity)